MLISSASRLSWLIKQRETPRLIRDFPLRKILNSNGRNGRRHGEKPNTSNELIKRIDKLVNDMSALVHPLVTEASSSRQISELHGIFRRWILSIASPSASLRGPTYSNMSKRPATLQHIQGLNTNVQICLWESKKINERKKLTRS